MRRRWWRRRLVQLQSLPMVAPLPEPNQSINNSSSSNGGGGGGVVMVVKHNSISRPKGSCKLMIYVHERHKSEEGLLLLLFLLPLLLRLPPTTAQHYYQS